MGVPSYWCEHAWLGDGDHTTAEVLLTVSGGRIVGSGANVTWDLSGVQPGTYTITSAVDNGCGFCGKTVTETITVRDCDCVPPCVCPTVSVSTPEIVQPNQPMTFTANLQGGSTADVTYTWSVSAGTISSAPR